MAKLGLNFYLIKGIFLQKIQMSKNLLIHCSPIISFLSINFFNPDTVGKYVIMFKILIRLIICGEEKANTAPTKPMFSPVETVDHGTS